MYLNEHEVKRFYTIWFALLHYVNEKRDIVPEFPQTWQSASVSPETAVKIRTVLWEDDALREAFIAENPAELSQADLAIVDSWQHRVSGNFFVFRHLKAYTVFIDEASPPMAYGVHGIVSPLEEVVGPYLPVYVQAVLLPFEDRIIYDSLLAPYPIHFGGGVKRSLNETYRRTKERGTLLTSLPPSQADALETAQSSNKKVLTAFQKALGKSGLSPKKTEEHVAMLTRFTNDFLHQQTPPRLLLDITEDDIDAFYTATSAKINWVSFKRFARFLRDTGRADWDVAEDMLDYIKMQQ